MVLRLERRAIGTRHRTGIATCMSGSLLVLRQGLCSHGGEKVANAAPERRPAVPTCAAGSPAAERLGASPLHPPGAPVHRRTSRPVALPPARPDSSRHLPRGHVPSGGPPPEGRLNLMRSGKLITRLDRYVFRQLLLGADRGHRRADGADLADPVAAIRRTGGQSRPVVRRLHGADRPADPKLRRCDPADHHLRGGAVHLQRLAGDRELTVMRAAGLSPFALSRPALVVAVLAMAACYGLNLVVVPASLRSFREFQWEIRNKVVAFLLQEGVFTQISGDMTVYVRSRDPSGRAAWHPDRRCARQAGPRDGAGRAGPAGGRRERAGGAAVQRHAPGDRSEDGAAGHPYVSSEHPRFGRRCP